MIWFRDLETIKKRFREDYDTAYVPEEARKLLLRDVPTVPIPDLSILQRAEIRSCSRLFRDQGIHKWIAGKVSFISTQTSPKKIPIFTFPNNNCDAYKLLLIRRICRFESIYKSYCHPYPVGCHNRLLKKEEHFS